MWYSKLKISQTIVRDYFISNNDSLFENDSEITKTDIPDEKIKFPKEDISEDWLDNAESWIGTPYVFGGNSKRGIDCSAFIQQVFPDKKLPRTANEQMKVGSDVSFEDTSSWQPGDRVYFDMGARLGSGNNVADHTGIYIGNNEFIQASSSKGVTVSNISPGSFYFKKLIAVKR